MACFVSFSLCDLLISDALDLSFPFVDEHGLGQTVPKDLENLKDWVIIPSLLGQGLNVALCFIRDVLQAVLQRD